MIRLPLEAYTSQTWFDMEQAVLFSKVWQLAGFVEDISEPGHFKTIQVGLHNIFIIRGQDRRLRAFHNLCPHRGTQLLRACGKAKKVINCPYHNWSFSMDGHLLTVPEQKKEFPNLKYEELGLLPASVEIWKGMVWVHPDPKAESLSQWLGDFDVHMGPHKPEEMVEYEDAASEHVIAANWKIVVENYVDGYHLSHLHSESLYMYDHRNQRSGFEGRHFYFFEPLKPKYAKKAKSCAPFPLIDQFTEEHPMGAYVPMIFPNIGISASESTWSTFHVLPLGPEKSKVVTRTRVMPASDFQYTMQAMRSYWFFGSRKPLQDDAIKAEGDFMAEDILVCEQQQKSLKSPYFAVGATAEFKEAAVVEFQNQVATFLKATSC